jgi:hypothetical protein
MGSGFCLVALECLLIKALVIKAVNDSGKNGAAVFLKH